MLSLGKSSQPTEAPLFRLTDIHGRLPPIFLFRHQQLPRSRDDLVVLGASPLPSHSEFKVKFAELRTIAPFAANPPRNVTHTIDDDSLVLKVSHPGVDPWRHCSIAKVQCAVFVTTRKAYVVHVEDRQPVEDHLLDVNAQTMVNSSPCVKSEPFPLTPGDVLWFRGCAPAFRVELAFSDPSVARDGSPATFRLLDLPLCLLHTLVFPHVPLGALGRLALTSEPAATMIQQLIERPEWWLQHTAAVTDTLGAAHTPAARLHAMRWVDSTRIALGQRTLWLHKNNPEALKQLFSNEADGTLPGATIANHWIILQRERKALACLVHALAVRKTADQLVELITTLSASVLGTRRGGKPNRKLSLLQSALHRDSKLPQRCLRGAWSVDLLVRVNILLGETGSGAGSVLALHLSAAGLLTADDSDSDSDDFDDSDDEYPLLVRNEAASRWLAATSDVDEQAAFVMGFYRVDDLFDLAVNLAARAYDGAYSAQLVGALLPVLANEALESVEYMNDEEVEDDSRMRAARMLERMNAPAIFLAEWANATRFPKAAALVDVEAVVRRIADCGAAGAAFGRLTMAWVRTLLEDAAALEAAATTLADGREPGDLTGNPMIEAVVGSGGGVDEHREKARGNREKALAVSRVQLPAEYDA